MNSIDSVFNIVVVIIMGSGLIISGMLLSPDDSFGVKKLFDNFKSKFKKHPTKS